MPLKLQLRPKKGRKILGKCEVRLRDERQVAHLRADGGDLAGGGGAALYLSPHPLPQVGRAATRPQNQLKYVFICFLRTTGKFTYQLESSYSVGTVGYEDVDCDTIDHTYVR